MTVGMAAARAAVVAALYNVLSADAPVGAPPEGNAKEVTRRRCRVTTTGSSDDGIVATGSLHAALLLPAAISSSCACLTPPCATALLDLRCTLGALVAPRLRHRLSSSSSSQSAALRHASRRRLEATCCTRVLCVRTSGPRDQRMRPRRRHRSRRGNTYERHWRRKKWSGNGQISQSPLVGVAPRVGTHVLLGFVPVSTDNTRVRIPLVTRGRAVF